MEKKIYTFKDWISRDLFTVKDSIGNEVSYNSENYLNLISISKLSCREFIKIRQAQRDTYDYIIEHFIADKAKKFKHSTSQSIDLEAVLNIEIQDVTNYINHYGSIYEEIIHPRFLHPQLVRGLKLGARAVLPEEYLAYEQKKLLPKTIRRLSQIPHITHFKNGTWSQFPYQDYVPDRDVNYQIMEVAILWYKWLLGYQKTYKQTGTTKNNSDKGEYYIKPELLGRLNEIEGKMSTIIKSWGTRNSGTKIKCAAFVELLMKKSFFQIEFMPSKIKTCVAFAGQRYNSKISIQMSSKEKNNRHKHQVLLEKYFK